MCGSADSATAEEERDTFVVATGVVDPVRVHDIPTRTQERQAAAEVGQIVAQFDKGDEVELSENFSGEPVSVSSRTKSQSGG